MFVAKLVNEGRVTTVRMFVLLFMVDLMVDEASGERRVEVVIENEGFELKKGPRLEELPQVLPQVRVIEPPIPPKHW